MAAFASSRRSGWVRVLVVILCALFIFATVATPPAYAVGETVALFGAAAVLSAAVAALGFKLSNDSDGIATLNKMVTDFAKEAWVLSLLVVGNRVNGLIDGMNYIKMAVHNGKTYLDERVIAWCQQWLGNNGVYESGDVSKPDDWSFFYPYPDGNYLYSDVSNFGVDPISFDSALALCGWSDYNFPSGVYDQAREKWDSGVFCVLKSFGTNDPSLYYSAYPAVSLTYDSSSSSVVIRGKNYVDGVYYSSSCYWLRFKTGVVSSTSSISFLSSDVFSANFLRYNVSENVTGLSGSDTIGEDYKDKTLDQILDGLKEWAADWVDAGADSATNTVTGALDLPLTVGDQAATANPALNPDVVYNPPFVLPWPDVRSGETSSSAVSEGQANADAAETATTDVAENQTVIDSLVNWALGYINPDTGLFSKFPLCVPYDAYLLVTSSLGVDAVGSDSIFGASPGDLDGVVTEGIETYSDFQPVINIEHDFELDGVTYPLSLTIDLTPWQPLVTFFREGLALLLVAELIGAEYKRIRGH